MSIIKEPTLLKILDHGVGGDAKRKAAFHREGKRLLNEVALALPDGEFDLRSNKGGPAVSGEITLHGISVYIQLSEGFRRGNEVLYRRCKGMSDYTGERNHYMSAAALCEPKAFARRVISDLCLDQDTAPSTSEEYAHGQAPVN